MQLRKQANVPTQSNGYSHSLLNGPDRLTRQIGAIHLTHLIRCYPKLNYEILVLKMKLKRNYAIIKDDLQIIAVGALLSI